MADKIGGVETEDAFTLKARADAEQHASDKAEKVEESENPQPVVKPAAAEIDDSYPEDKDLNNYEKYASNDGEFVLSKLDDQTNVEEGNVMENQAREPAHQQHELQVEEDAAGYEQASALMTPRYNPHYDGGGGSVSEVSAGASFGETSAPGGKLADREQIEEK